MSQHFKSFLSHINQFMIAAEGNIWFRGHSNIGVAGEKKDYILQSSLFRITDDLEIVKKLERSYLYEFMTKGYSLHQTTNESELLYLMQHHGTPTRLLDWTSSLSTALYFATRNWNPHQNEPSLWILNPSKLNMMLQGDDALNILPDNLKGYLNKSNLSSMAISPMYNSPRLIAQQGQFTLQGNFEGDLYEEVKSKEVYNSDVLLEIKIPIDLFDDIISFLHMSGVNDFSLYPDLDGLSKVISKRKSFYQ